MPSIRIKHPLLPRPGIRRRGPKLIAAPALDRRAHRHHPDVRPVEIVAGFVGFGAQAADAPVVKVVGFETEARSESEAEAEIGSGGVFAACTCRSRGRKTRPSDPKARVECREGVQAAAAAGLRAAVAGVFAAAF
jgi:hypothetical protein